MSILALEQASISLLDQIPGIFYAKNNKLEYIAANSNFTELMGLPKAGDIIGMRDADLPNAPSDELYGAVDWANIFMHENQQVLKGQHLYILNVHIIAGEVMAFRTQRKPWVVDGVIQGVMCLSHRIEDINLDTINALLLDPKYIVNEASMAILRYYFQHHGLSSANLTGKELVCLVKLLQGYPMQRVAADMGVSIKTIEYYHAKIKNKLRCNSRESLIDRCHEFALINISHSELLSGIFL